MSNEDAWEILQVDHVRELLKALDGRVLERELGHEDCGRPDLATEYLTSVLIAY